MKQPNCNQPVLNSNAVFFSHIPQGYDGEAHAAFVYRRDNKVTVHSYIHYETFKLVNNSFCHKSSVCSMNDLGLCSCPIEKPEVFEDRQLTFQWIALDGQIGISGRESILRDLANLDRTRSW
jgi:hypothetical protein